MRFWTSYLPSISLCTLPDKPLPLTGPGTCLCSSGCVGASQFSSNVTAVSSAVWSALPFRMLLLDSLSSLGDSSPVFLTSITVSLSRKSWLVTATADAPWLVLAPVLVPIDLERTFRLWELDLWCFFLCFWVAFCLIKNSQDSCRTLLLSATGLQHKKSKFTTGRTRGTYNKGQNLLTYNQLKEELVFNSPGAKKNLHSQ